MKTYKVTVNGTLYEITLEAVDKADVKAAPVLHNEQPYGEPVRSNCGSHQMPRGRGQNAGGIRYAPPFGGKGLQ